MSKTGSGRNGVRGNHPSDKIVAEIAWLYYIKGLTQGEVGARKSMSRPTVINYLKLAKERGIVSIKLAPEHLRINELSSVLSETFQVDQVHVVPSTDADPKEMTRAVSEVAAHVLPQLLEEGDQLGVSWGETISYLAEMVPNWPIRDLTVRQLIGSMANPLIPTSESCTTEIARRLSGYCINMNAPAVCSNVALAKALKQEPIISEQLASLSLCNKTVFSLSPCTPDTHVVHFKVASKASMAAYRKRGAVCNIVGRFLDADGNPVRGELDERLFTVELAELRTMEGLLVVSGTHKAQAALAALRGGYVNNMVLDDGLANAILDLC